MPKDRTATHGGYTLYASGCRCDLCREWKRLSDAEYRASRRAETEQPPITEPLARAYAARDALLRMRRSEVLPATRPNTSATTGEVPMTAGQKKLAEILAKNMKPSVPQAPRSAPRYQIPQKPPPRIDADGVVHEEAGWE